MQIDHAQIERSLRAKASETDAFRELNFVEPTWQGVDALLEFLPNHYGIKSAARLSDPIDKTDRAALQAAARASGEGLFLVLSSAALVHEFRVTIYPEYQSPSVQVVFHAHAVIDSPTLTHDFVAFAEQLMQVLSAAGCEAQHDNNWDFADHTSRHIFLAIGKEVSRIL